MNEPRAANPRRLFVFAGLLILLSLVLLFWAREFIREVFVVPLSYLWWAITTISIVVPQIYQWIAVVALALLIVLRTLSPRKKKVAPTPPVLAELDYDNSANRGRLSFWATKIDLVQSGSSGYYQSTFHNALGRLLIDLLAHRYRLPSADVETRLRADPSSEAAAPLGATVPPEIREYALYSLRRAEIASTNWFSFFLRSLKERLSSMLGTRLPFKNRPASPQPSRPLDARVARVIQYMEEELEVSNDHSGD